MTTQRWVLRRQASPQFLSQTAALGLDPLLAKVLYARKIDTPERIRAFLSADGDLSDPFRMPDMGRAVERLKRALQHHEPIVVYGDFDADGVSATVLLTTALNMLGGQVSAYIPDRFSEAYGLNTAALQRLHSQGVRLVVSVDCGVRSVEEVARARAWGLDIIVTDHHSPQATLPPALAVVDPKRPDCRYPFKELSGVGVAYRLVEGLWRAMRPGRARTSDDPEYATLLDLVALGTVADIVPLYGENRLLVQWGLQKLRAEPRPGLRALMEVAGTQVGEVDSQAIAFRLGPRLNAAGRMASAQMAYQLLVTDSDDEAARLAAELNAVNQQRQELLEKQLEQARAMLGDGGDRPLLFIEGPDFHEGIVGLVASRLTEEFYRPTLVMRRGAETTRGSARSIEGFHITQALDVCADLLVRHGGHARAAGFTLRNENLPTLRGRLEEYAAEHLTPEILSPQHHVDAIVGLDEITPEATLALAALEPLGEGNPEPALATLGLKLLAQRAVGADGKHLRLEVSDGTRTFSAIAFRQGHLAEEFAPGDTIDLVYRPALNEWQGEVSVQLVVGAMRKSTGGKNG